jgi:nucleoside 2-deoxyribosyltransferase
MTPVVYLASPIDQGNMAALREEAKAGLLLQGCAVFDPAAGWSVPARAEPSPALQAANMRLLTECDAVLALLDPTILTVGVTLELNAAHGKPTHVWAPNLRPSWSLAYLGVTIHKYLDDAIKELMYDVRI